MREIKFRGMDVKGNWYIGNLAIVPPGFKGCKAGSFISNKAGMPFAYEVRPETVGQYTCRKDKNGKMIFKGDVVKKIDSFPGDDGDEIKISIGVVTWVEEWPMFSVKLIEGEDESFEHSEGINFYWEELEIIGNIWNNPESLKTDENQAWQK
jgi:uncharacterized phage protein (TIGR01671 family)